MTTTADGTLLERLTSLSASATSPEELRLRLAASQALANGNRCATVADWRGVRHLFEDAAIKARLAAGLSEGRHAVQAALDQYENELVALDAKDRRLTIVREQRFTAERASMATALEADTVAFDEKLIEAGSAKRPFFAAIEALQPEAAALVARRERIACHQPNGHRNDALVPNPYRFVWSASVAELVRRAVILHERKGEKP